MQGFMEKKQEKDFIVMKNKITAILVLFVASLSALYISCSKKNGEVIPTAPVNLTIDLNLPAYYHLNNPGTSTYLPGGVKGVILIHDFDNNWYAFERTCGYQPLNNCSQIWLDSMELKLKCGIYSNNTFTKCCDSKYYFNGLPAGGQSVTKLHAYRIQKNGNVITIY